MALRRTLISSIAAVTMLCTGLANSGINLASSRIQSVKASAGISNSSIHANINVWGWPGSFQEMQDSIGIFHKVYPNIDVTFDTASWATTQDKLAIAIGAGSGAPDVSWVDGSQIQHFIAKGGLVNVTSSLGSA